MKAYWALFVGRARVLLQYRLAALAALFTNFFFGFVMINVLIAFYAQSQAEQPMTLLQTITYTWMGQVTLGILPWNTDREVAASVRTGAIAYDLTRPLDMYAHWYARAMALRTAPTLLRCVPMLLIATFLLPASYALQWPSIAGVLAWLAAMGGALLLSCAITVLMQVSMFWTVTGDGITRILPHFVTLLSGMVIPLPLMPDWMQIFLRFQPFATVSGAPSLLFAGVYPPSDVWGILALQLFWTAFFICVGRLVMNRGLRKLTLAGG